MHKDPISLIITPLDVKGGFSNTPHRLLRTIWEHMGLCFQGFLHAYLATRLYAVQTDVGTTPLTHPTSKVPGGSQQVHSQSCSSPSRWPSTYNAPTLMWHHTRYGPRS